MSLDDLTRSVRQFATDRDWGQFHSPRNLILATQAELGELAEIVQWVPDQDMDELWVAENRARLEEEIADVLIYIVRLADVLGIDLEESAVEKIRRNGEKYPVELARGSASKYTELDRE